MQMKRWVRVVSMTSVLCVLFGSASIAFGLGSAVGALNSDYTYTVSGGLATIIGYSGSGGAVTIPSTLGGFSTVAIGSSAFSHSAPIVSISIPSSVTSIDPWAFGECTSLIWIEVAPGSTTYSSMGGNLYSKDSTMLIQCPQGMSGAVVVPYGTIIIGEGAFTFCTKVTSVTVPDSVTSISDVAFQNCVGMASITIGTGVESIGAEAFFCSGLRSITFLGLVAPTSIGYNWIGNGGQIAGHAYPASDFPPKGSEFYGLYMGTYAGVPGMPTGLTARPGIGQAYLSWMPPVNSGDSPITGYVLHRYSAGKSDQIILPISNSYVDTGLTGGQEYQYSISAFNAQGMGEHELEIFTIPTPNDNTILYVGVAVAIIIGIVIAVMLARKKRK